MTATIRDELFHNVSAITERAVFGRVFRLLGIDPDLPAEWATVDRCLTWLRERGYLLAIVEVMITGDFYVCVAMPSDSEDESGPEAGATAPTLHAALIAACRAVQEAS